MLVVCFPIICRGKLALMPCMVFGIYDDADDDELAGQMWLERCRMGCINHLYAVPKLVILKYDIIFLLVSLERYGPNVPFAYLYYSISFYYEIKDKNIEGYIITNMKLGYQILSARLYLISRSRKNSNNIFHIKNKVFIKIKIKFNLEELNPFYCS